MSTRDGDAELYQASLPLDATKLGPITRLTNSPGYDGQPALSPDGARLAWVSMRGAGDDSNATQIFLGGPMAQRATALASGGKTNLSPAFVGSGARLLFTSDRDANSGGGLDLYLVALDAPVTVTGAPIERITFGNGFNGDASVSPDGSHIAFSSSRGGPSDQTNVFVARLTLE
ncbi:MAG: hypothetical protein EXR75_14225 [Myxococcales bacterium]|nr:hypothetical protein [Myxococcales bacterium]